MRRVSLWTLFRTLKMGHVNVILVSSKALTVQMIIRIHPLHVRVRAKSMKQNPRLQMSVPKLVL